MVLMLNNHILDHIGVAVSNLDRSIKKYHDDFGFMLDSREILHHLEVEVAFLALPNTKIELIMPTPGSKNPLVKFLSTHGEGLHHLCYEVSDIRAELASLKQKGYQLIDEEPRQGANGSIIAFVHPESVSGHVLTELCEYP